MFWRFLFRPWMDFDLFAFPFILFQDRFKTPFFLKFFISTFKWFSPWCFWKVALCENFETFWIYYVWKIQMFDTKFLKHFFLKLNVRFCVTFIEYINRSSFSSRVFILVFECPTVAKKIMIFFVIVELLKKLVTQQVKDFILVFECPTVMIFFLIV